MESGARPGVGGKASLAAGRWSTTVLPALFTRAALLRADPGRRRPSETRRVIPLALRSAVRGFFSFADRAFAGLALRRLVRVGEGLLRAGEVRDEVFLAVRLLRPVRALGRLPAALAGALREPAREWGFLFFMRNVSGSIRPFSCNRPPSVMDAG